MIFAPSLRARIPYNGLILVLFTICKSTVVAFISVQNRQDLGRASILTSVTVFLGLVLLNCQFKRQSTVLFEICFVSLLCFTIFGSLLFFFQGSTWSLIYSGTCVLVFSLASVSSLVSLAIEENVLLLKTVFFCIVCRQRPASDRRDPRTELPAQA